MLVIVLWLLALLTVMTMAFSSSIRTETQSMRNIIDKARADHLADAAIQYAISSLLNTTPETPLSRDGSSSSLNFAGEQLQLQIWDEHGKIDINIVTEEQLQSLFLSLELEMNQADALVGAIIDWRDEDELRHLNGAEASEYIHAGLRSRPSNKPFLSISELQQVIGFDRWLYSRIAPLVTVNGYGSKINPEFASREALLALPGVDHIEVEALLEARAQRTENQSSEPLPKLSGVDSWLTNAIGPVYTIRGSVKLNSGTQSVREIVVWLPQMGEIKNYYVLESRVVDNLLNGAAIRANYME